MQLRTILALIGALPACILATSTSAEAGEIAADLEPILSAAAPDERVAAVVLMEAFPSQQALLTHVRGLSPEARRAFVIKKMKTLAASSQRELRAILDDESLPVSKLRVLWGINGIALEASPSLLRRIAARPEVLWVLHDKRLSLAEMLDTERETAPRRDVLAHTGDGDGPTGGDSSGPNPNADVGEWLGRMQVPRVWNELGYTGSGVIVAIIDDGVDRTHPDIADHIWTNLKELAGNDVDDDNNGYTDDTWGWDFKDNDNNPTYSSHGLRVAGQIAGDGTNGWVTGVAPDAELMALRVGGPPSQWWEASDYAIANGADIISQSYSKKWTNKPDYAAFRRQTDTELAAGVLHVNSTGNTGRDTDKPVPYNVATPGNCPPPWHHPDQTLAGGLSSVIGAANIDFKTDVITATSPYGPAAWEDIQANTDPAYPSTVPEKYRDYPYENGARQGLLKPDIAAYGDNTWTICNSGGIQNSYCGFSGTSSATPHLAGVAALILSAYPDATPAELAQAMLTTAAHRGDPGKNNRYGVGLVQAYKAVLSVAPNLLFESFQVDDNATGNGDGALDPGEQLILRITLRNRSDQAISDVSAYLRTETQGITIHNNFALFGTIGAEALKVSAAPHYSISIDAALCGKKAVFALDLRYGDAKRTVWFRARIGDEVPLVFLDEDFESDTGWSSDPGTASRGAWVREDPIGTFLADGKASNPEDDVSEQGTHAWVTGNGELSGAPGADNNDVDAGEVRLLSPSFGSEAPLARLSLKYYRWATSNQRFLAGDDFFRAELSHNGGGSWTELESTAAQANFWLFRRFNLLLVAAPTANMQLRFRMNDAGEDSTVEAGLDELKVEGLRIDCDTYHPEATKAPNGISDTLRVVLLSSKHVKLSWQTPPADKSHDAATLFRIKRSAKVQSDFNEVGSAGANAWLDADAAKSNEKLFAYLVTAENVAGVTP